jgi:hypothetical protein
VISVSGTCRVMPALLTTNVNAPETLERKVDEPRGAVRGRDVVEARAGRASRGTDLLDDRSGGLARRPAAAGRAAEVVDHDGGAALGQQQDVRAADAAAGAGDHRDAPVEGQLGGYGHLYAALPRGGRDVPGGGDHGRRVGSRDRLSGARH